jgi:hypothetical protein
MKRFEQVVKALAIYNSIALFIFCYMGLKDEGADYPLLGSLFVSGLCLSIVFMVKKSFYLLWLKNIPEEKRLPYGIYVFLWFALLSIHAFPITKVLLCFLKTGIFAKYPACSLFGDCC